jgi:hypothetical protein
MSEHKQVILPKITVENVEDRMDCFIEEIATWQQRGVMLGYANYTAEDRVALAYNLAWVLWNSWGGSLKYRFRPELIQRKISHNFNILKTKDVGSYETTEVLNFIVEMNSAMKHQEDVFHQVRNTIAELQSTLNMLQYEKNMYSRGMEAIQIQFTRMVKASDLPQAQVDEIMEKLKVIQDTNLGQNDFVSVYKDMQDALEKAVANEKQATSDK